MKQVRGSLQLVGAVHKDLLYNNDDTHENIVSRKVACCDCSANNRENEEYRPHGSLHDITG